MSSYIGIIGGADGPTAVFVTTRSLMSYLPLAAAAIAVVAAAVIGFIFISKK